MIVAILRDDGMRVKASNSEQQNNEPQNEEVLTSIRLRRILRFSLGLWSAGGDPVTLDFAPKGGTVDSQFFSRSCGAPPVSFQRSDDQIALHIIQHRHVLSFGDTGSSRGWFIPALL